MQTQSDLITAGPLAGDRPASLTGIPNFMRAPTSGRSMTRPTRPRRPGPGCSRQDLLCVMVGELVAGTAAGAGRRPWPGLA